MRDLLAEADIVLDGDRPWDVQVHDKRFAARLLAEGSLGLGESYMDGWWSCDALDEMSCRAIRAGLDGRLPRNLRMLVSVLWAVAFNLQTRRRSRRVGKHHYDLGNDFFEAMLDPAMQYSCAYFQGGVDLAQAQVRKMDLICRKLGLEPGMRLLDIGCGWGGLARYAAERHGCEVIGITISQEQCAYAQTLCSGLPVHIRLQDYRDLAERFDRVVSVGMLEHVGTRNYRKYFEVVSKCLDRGGLFLCQAIAGDRPSVHCDPWFERYIFPNSILPSAAQVAHAAEGLLILEDVHNFGADYDHTLMAWDENFRTAWPRFASRYGERFWRMWRFYLLSCAGAFRARSLQLYQFVFSHGGISGGWAPVR